jgi:hypothetical protein
LVRQEIADMDLFPLALPLDSKIITEEIAQYGADFYN